MRYRTLFAATALAAATTLSVGLTANAAPTTYESAVLANDPYVFYRLNETSGTTADDTSANNRDGTYVGTPTFGVAGAGTGSDSAVSFPGSDYVSSPLQSFGTSVPNSSYEFVFRSNTEDYADQAALFGVFSAATTGRTGNEAVSIEFNTANANNALNTDTTRFYLRDEDGQVLYGNIEQGNLLDGEYHHFVVTTDLSATNLQDKVMAYIDGVAVPVTVAQSASGTPTDFLDFTVDPTFAARNVRGNVGLFADVTIDEAVLYNRVLTSGEVAANFAATTIPEPTTLGLLGVVGLGLLRRRTR